MKKECMLIEKMLTISTFHISKRTAHLIGLEQIPLVIYPKDGYGWFLYLDLESCEKEELSSIPEDLWKIISFAKMQGCNWLCLDCDGEMLKQLPVFDW